MFANEFKAIRRMGFRQVFNHIIAFVSLMRARGQALLQALNFCNVIASGLMMWKGLGLLTNTESPIVVVLRYLVPTYRLPRRCIC
jgi:signal peptidase I